MDWTTQFAQRTQYVKRSAIREILKVTQQPDVISFAGGLPAAELFPLERIRAVTDEILAERGMEAMQYSVSEGLPELRSWVAQRLSDERVKVMPSNVLITTGSQQALDLLGKVLIDEQDLIAIENPTYLGALQAWGRVRPNYLSISADDSGMNVEHLATLLGENRPKFIYTPPNFQNPRGTTLTLKRRQQLANLLNQHNLPLIEDDPYGELRYSGEPLPSILSLDAKLSGKGKVAGNVVHTGTISKTLTPGLRVGWIVAPEPLIDKLVEFKQGADLHTNTLAQLIVIALMQGDFLDGHILTLRNAYRQRRDFMLAALDRHFPTTVSWTKPDGGLFLMVTLPEQMDATELLKQALTRKVAFVPGSAFHVGNQGHNTLRLNFSNATPTQIEEGVKRLGNLISS